MRWFVLFSFVMLALGCAPGKSPGPSSSTSPKADFKVALLTPGPVSDAGWSAMAYEGLQAIKTEMSAEVSNQQASSSAEIRDAMRSYAQKDYDLVFGHGYEYNAPAMEIGKDFPNTVFVSSSGDKAAGNVGTFRFYLEQGFYLAGMMAAEMSKTGKIAMIGGPDVPSIRSTFEAFKAGARAAKPGIGLIETFTGSGDDVAKAKLATLAAINAGADFVIHQANAAAQGVFDACKERKVYAFGANLNQNENASGVVIASAVINARPAFLDLAKRVKDGSFKGEVILMGMDKEAIDFLVNPALQNLVPEPLLAKLMDTKAKLRAGEIKAPMAKF
ncbi:MAG: BMP family protein [Fimbriimonadaceae bacterium]